MSRSLSAAGIFCLLNVVSPISYAETLQEAWSTALQSSNQVVASKKQVEASDAFVSVAKAARYPSLTLTGTYTAIDNPIEVDIALPDSITFDPSDVQTSPLFQNLLNLFPDFVIPIPDGFQTFVLPQTEFGVAGVQAALPLYTGGQITNAIKAAKSRREATEWQSKQTTYQVMLNVASAYTGVLRTQRFVKAAEQQVSTLAEHVNDVQNLSDAGMVARSDLLGIKSAHAQAEQRLLQAKNGEMLAKSAYNQLMNRDLDVPVQLEEVAPPGAAPSLEDSINQAKNQRPELKTLESTVSALDHAANAIAGGAMPKVGLTAGYQYLDVDMLADKTIGYAGIGMQWKLLDWGIVRNQTKSARSNAEATRAQVEDVRRGISLQVRQAWLDLDAALNQISVAKTSLDYSSEGLRETQERFRNSMATNSEVLDAETRRTGSEVAYDNAVYNAIYNDLRLKYATGNLSPDLVK